ncbi:MFS transporter [Deinococcus cellulosilyticus]|uniref:MFS transporter n=1 Tax=Deinococcus cellulosilyticus (strain DSM 18568 / NBRC 106333 / KACC 11606 / 5516J-15) TaxID=1223518 RepID=A0A511NA13_DEIC1|nr:MFS transporter [Deinococcus cellulosilyticus]GEM49356.1 MFS transporter [Deinococcus cellulosilyticus NBRC 106333 = KACC 11606]
MKPTAKKKTESGLMLLMAAISIEFMDELVDGVSGAAWPLIQQDLSLSYLQVGILLGAPALLANLIEPILSLLADLGWRRRLLLWGGVGYTIGMALIAMVGGFWGLLAAMVLYYPASGMFVNLMQAAWMDAEPERREQNMAKWALAGSVGNVLGPLLISFLAFLGLGWRPGFVLLAVLMGLALWFAFRIRHLLEEPAPPTEQETLLEGLKGAGQALLKKDVRLYLILLEFANLMLDIFRGFIALYFVDVVGTGEAQAALAVTVLTGVGLLGDALVVPLLERVSGLAYMRVSVVLILLLFPIFMLTPGLVPKLVLLGLLGILTSGWYAILQARLYASLPEKSGTVLALGSIAGLVGGLFPLLLGAWAQLYGLNSAMWLLIAGPVVLLLGLPARDRMLGKGV